MKTKYIWLATVTLLAALMISGPAFAEGEEPPAPPAEPAAVEIEAAPPAPEAPAAPAPAAGEAPAEVPAAPAEEPSAPAQPAVDTPVDEQPAPSETPAEELPVVDTPVDEPSLEAAPVEAAPQEETLEPVLEAQPSEEPAIQLVDAEGEALDLVSVESADLLVSGDPYWQVGGLYYSSVTTPSLCYGTTWADGRCYISANPVQNAIELIAADSGLIPTNGKIYMDYGVYGDVVTIDGLAHPNLLSINGLIGNTDGSGLLFPTLTKSITIRNMNNGFMIYGLNVTGGIFINDSSGQFILESVTAPVTMTNVDANGRTGRGVAFVNHKGNITLTKVSANSNSNGGAVINNTRGGNVTINGGSTFNGNGLSYGLYISSIGLVNLDGVSASDNYSTGIFVDSCSSLTIKNAIANSNGWSGIYANPYNKPITLENITTNENDHDGISLYDVGSVTAKTIIANLNKTYGMFVQTETAATFSLQGGTFNNNVEYGGLYVQNKNNIVVSEITANQNGEEGVRLSNDWHEWWGSGLYLGYGSVTLTSPIGTTNTFTENGLDGVIISSKGNINISNTFADNNLVGLRIDNCLQNGSFCNGIGTVTLTNVTAVNNPHEGFLVSSKSTITMNSIKATGNDNEGVWVYSAMGAVTINNAVANFNQGFGMNISGRGVTLRNIIARSNGSDGLYVNQTAGTTLLENVVANDNHGGNGVLIDTPANMGALTLRNITASNNAWGGIYAYTSGAVTVTNSTTENNYRDNDPGEDTGGNGLFIQTKGAVTLTTIWSSNNGTNGLFVQGIKNLVSGSEVMSSPTSITLTSPLDSNFTNFFAGNGRLTLGGSGIKIISQLPVTLRNFTVRENHDNGVDINGPELYDAGLGKTEQKRSGAVTIASTLPNWRNRVEKNNIGVYIFSAGTVNLGSLNSGENMQQAIFVDTQGAITLSNVYDWGSGIGNAVLLNNLHTTAYMPVTISNLEVRETRGDSGAALEVDSRGAITITGLWLENNGNAGAALANAMGGRGNVSLTNATIQNNLNLGIQAFSNGAILFTNVRVQNNGGGGAQIFNNGAPSAMPVTLTDCVFENNQGTGLEVFSKGLISLRGVEARWNYIRYGSMDEGSTLYETNQPDWGGVDEMNFLSSGDPVTVILRSLDEWDGFEPIVELVDEFGSVISPDPDPINGDGVWTSVFSSLASGKKYFIRVLFDDSFSNGFGKYSLSINDPDESNPVILADGAVLDNTDSTALTPPGVTILPTASRTFNVFEGNNGTGLNIKTRGVVTLTNLYANNNTFGEGLFMDNPNAVGAVTVQSLVVTSPGSFSSNGGSGLYIRTRGAITLSNIEAFNNQLSGADLDNALCNWDEYEELWTNCLGSGAITIKSPSGRTSWFNDNQNFGIWAVSRGAITLTNISAYGNGWDGALLWNDGRNSAASIAVNTAGAVRNEFNENARNTSDPAPWFNSIPDGLPGFFYESEYYWARFNGLTIMSGGNISIYNSNVNWNRNDIGSGMNIMNDKALTPKTVLISNTEVQGNYWGGIRVRSKGAITLTSVSAWDNGEGNGISLDNALCTWDDLLKKWSDCTPGGVTMTNIYANNHGGTGLEVYSQGLITLTGAWVNNNSLGIHLDNNYSGTLLGITMTNVNANDNRGIGLEALSRGLISLKGGETSNNWDNGMRLQNNFDGTAAGITIVNASANNNGNTGISLETKGALIMTSLAASSNFKTGGDLWLDEESGGMSVQDYYNADRGPDHWYFDAESGQEYTFTLTANSEEYLNLFPFDPWIELYYVNHETGEETQLDITDIEKMVSEKQCATNDSCEFTFDPAGFGYGGTVSFYVKVGSNNGDGFYRLSMNDLDPNSIEESFWVDGLAFNAGGNVTMTGTNSFNNNSLAGMIGTSLGTIRLANVGAFNNGTEGISLKNTGSLNASVFMTGTNITNNNGREGLDIETNGVVNLTNVEASYNGYRSGGSSSSVNIVARGVAQAVYLTNVRAMHNCQNGITLDVNGISTFNNVRAWLNGDWDANEGSGSGSGVHMYSHGYAINLLNFCSFMGNADSGFAYQDSSTFTPTNSVIWGNQNTDAGPYH